ncbi:MAG: Coenzyme F420 hydrogenase/dehydrogenase, beta subunit C-terminal domain [Granulosicoccus sp.]|nr:Coenzyme F420 hydrogenase/dehydrogenase, beta subunit C-terminal domain [Granulosicoccus sp.]
MINSNSYPLIYTPELAKAAPRSLCTDCGISRTAQANRCATACQFIQPDYPKAEQRVHGRTRELDKEDELYFGPYQAIYRASLHQAAPGAQWTGITTRLAERLLETAQVDAVIAVAPDPDDRWRPNPVIVTEASAMRQCRGMRMGYAPTLALLEPALEAGFKRLAVIGIPCQVYALRELEDSLRRDNGLESLFVIGTPCSDNTTTENFHYFLSKLTDEPKSISYLEFRADYHVEIRFDDGRQQLIPFLKLPLSDLPIDFFPTTCRTCVDYTNALADITVGYMGGEGEQWLIVRNAKGQTMLDNLKSEIKLAATGERGNRRSSVKGFIANTRRAAGGLPLRSMPDWLRPLMAWLMPKVGPRGLEFARARVEMKAAECVLHLRRLHPKRMKSMVPQHIWEQLKNYQINPSDSELTQKTSKRIVP